MRTREDLCILSRPDRKSRPMSNDAYAVAETGPSEALPSLFGQEAGRT